MILGGGIRREEGIYQGPGARRLVQVPFLDYRGGRRAIRIGVNRPEYRVSAGSRVSERESRDHDYGRKAAGAGEIPFDRDVHRSISFDPGTQAGRDAVTSPHLVV